MKLNNVDTVAHLGERVVLKGWANVVRKMGKLVFVDLRDRSGIVQVICHPADMEDEQSIENMALIRPEWVLEIQGEVKERGEKQKNPDMKTGSVEVVAKKLIVINQAETPPFEIDNEERRANEELRLKYRYLDLRHERMLKNLTLRHQILHFVRRHLTEQEGFIEVQTPILTKSSPEGARDYLVPSRKWPGKFFALPQSPQQYKQLLMVAGMERYFQVAPCFRDEDARADRSPGEFYQLDMEMSFMKQEEILELVEKMFTKMIKELFPDYHFTFEPWPRLNYDDVMRDYNSDKPDLRKDKNDPKELAFAWVINFPLFVDQNKEDEKFVGARGRWAPSHHMFTSPKAEHMDLLFSEDPEAPGKIRSDQHDLVLNGLEVGGGSVRIHDPKVQSRVFDLIGFSEEEKKYFDHMLEAFKYGVPPHGGIAPGLDRLISILAGEPNIREIIAFPLTSDARDPLMGAPAEVFKEQLDELHVKLDVDQKNK